MGKFFTSQRFLLIASFLGLYFISAGASLAVFSYLKDNSAEKVVDSKNLGGIREKIAQMPKTEECIINGKMHTTIEKKIWEERRPLIAMIENSVDARPQSGLSKADVVYEAVAEGGITRFMAVFYCAASSEDVKIAPVRSARIYFVNLAAGYGNKPIFMHVGGANDFSGFGDTAREARALETLETMGWRVPKGNDFDTIYDSGYPVFWRDYERLGREVATEHTMMASLDAAYAQAKKRGFEAKDSEGEKWDDIFKPWKFSEGKASSAPTAGEISFEFWSDKPDYNVTWKYDSASNTYLRFNGGNKHTDHTDGQQLSAQNVVVMFAKEKGPVDRNLHMLYEVIGEGSVLIFQNGEVIDGIWEKTSRSQMLRFKNSKGAEIPLVRGVTWVEVLPKGNEVNYN